MHARIKILGCFLILIWICLVTRLFYIQVYRGNEFALLSKNQYLKEEILPPSRGDILDRNGRKLATDLAYYEFSAEPPLVKDAWKVATVFAQYLEKSHDDYLRILKQDEKFVYLHRKVPAEIAEKILHRELKGVNYTTEFKRFYPYGDITGQLIGFPDVDNVGIEGLEFKFNEILAGIPGKRILTTDALGNQKTDFNYPVQKPVSGNNIITTLDLDCQIIAFEELTKAIEQYDAVSGTVILMNPMTGEILAMVSLPACDSNNPGAVQPHLRKNRSINDTFEPGSIFKIVTAAAALEMGIVSPEDTIFCENGQIRFGRRIFSDAKPYGNLTVKEVIEHSSNIGTYKIAEKAGTGNLYKFAKKFGFGSKTGIEFGGESPGILRNTSEWTSHSLASIAIGQEITVNALQLVNSYAAVANGGILMKPYIVSAIYNQSGAIIKEFKPQTIRRVVSKRTAEILTSFFEGVVDHGTAVSAKIPGNTIAGKTGTAQKVDPETKTYSNKDFISSFVAYYPSKNPKIAGIVIIDSPKGKYYGGTVAAPVMKNIINRITHVPGSTLFASFVHVTDNEPEQKSVFQALLRLASGNHPKYFPVLCAADEKADDPESQGEDKKSRSPRSFVIKLDREKEDKNSENGPTAKNQNLIEVPEVTGISIREAVNILVQKGLNVKITSGSGFVAEQSPLPGTKVVQGRITYLRGENTENLSGNKIK
ncbi:hypothetical protein AMJ80_09975 [bacterium SM23_31]|nr:MAG: hypothetical protein AMJ80_09975 [bacterium SM23_31]